MDQFRQVGEIIGSLKAQMVLKHDISINQKQCCLLYDILEFAFETVSEEIRQNLKLEERNTKWKALELPMKELHRIFKEADLFIRHCLDVKDWWGKAISLHMNRDAVEFHIHNLLCCFPVVIEAIETAAEISGMDQEEMQKRRITLLKKYDEEFAGPKLFQWKYGKQYLVTRYICSRLNMAYNEDKWSLLQKIEEKKTTALSKHEQKLSELLLRKLNEAEGSKEKLMPSHVLVGSHDYFVKRRLGGTGGGHFKEIHWLGENFALRTFFGDIEPLNHDISLVLSLSHPSVLQYHCAFYDEERKEGFLVMELMSKDLGTYIKEHSGQRKRVPFSVPVAVDIMLQIARGMEYLHSNKIYHGDLNPSKILLKARNSSMDGFFLAKVAGFELTSIKSVRNHKQTGADLDFWLAPEVLAELEQLGGKSAMKYSEKADVYSFAMLCFELLTGKIPFQDSQLEGEKLVRNVRAGVRPLFSYPSPKYLTNLTRRCWQTDPNSRPTFSAICRILRFVKKNLVINPDHGHPDSPPPLVDYCDIEAGFLKKFEHGGDLATVSQIPFQMFAYRLIEKEKVSGKHWETGMDRLTAHHLASLGDYDTLALVDDLFPASDQRSVCSEIIDRKNSTMSVDQRSVISEIPHRKLFSSDQRSIGSESPGKRFLAIGNDQRSIGAKTPEKTHIPVRNGDQSSFQALEKKIDQKSTNPKLNVDVPDKATVLKVAVDGQASNVGQSPSPTDINALTKGMAKDHIVLSKGIEQKLENAEIIENKLLLKGVNEYKPTFSESSEGKISSSRAIPHHKLAEIPEKKILKSTEEEVSVSPKASAKKVEKTDKSTQKSTNSYNFDKKPFFIGKLKDTRTKSVPGKTKNDSPRSSPARVLKKTKPIFSPSSSVHAQVVDYSSSPASSPLHPCTRCSRLGKQTSLPSSSPQRPKTVSASHSSIVM